MDREGNFRSALMGGFRKSDVLAYVDKLCEEAKRSETEYTARLRELDAQRKQSLEKIDELERSLSENKTRAQNLQDLLTELEEKMTALTAECEEKDRDLRYQIDGNKQLLIRNAELEEKGRKFDEISGQVAETIFSAKKSATMYLKDAKARADRICTEAENSVQQTYEALDGFSDDIDRLAQTLDDVYHSLSGRIDVLRESAAVAKQRLQQTSLEPPAAETPEAEGEEDLPAEQPQQTAEEPAAEPASAEKNPFFSASAGA